MLSKIHDTWDDIFGKDFLKRSHFPAANIEDQKDKYIITLACPGMDKKDFDVKIENRTLVISAKKEEETEKKEKNFTKKEFSFRSFERSFTLPDVNVSNISAEYKSGILEIILPKREGHQSDSKKIAIK